MRSVLERAERRSWWPLVGLTVLLAVGHICALPGHAAHGGPSLTAHADDHAAEHHGRPADDGASHLDSCDGLRSGPVSLVVALVAAPVTTWPVARSRSTPSSERWRAFVAKSPPLFLLHASLLI